MTRWVWQCETLHNKIANVNHCVFDQKVEAKPNVLVKLFGNEAVVFVQVFSIIFLAEWGDKSQMSTVLLAAKDVRT